MFQRAIVPVVASLCFVASCDIDVPVNPNAIFIPIERVVDGLQQGLQDALSDPLGSKPFPVLIGGDGDRVFYATNLGDVRLNFRGPANDFVMPGFFGPTNVYEYSEGTVKLNRPFVLVGPAGRVGGLVADGTVVAYLASLDADFLSYDAIVVDDLGAGGVALTRRFIYERKDGEFLSSWGALALDARRLAYDVADWGSGDFRIEIASLDGSEPVQVIATEGSAKLRLQGDWLAYTEFGTDRTRVLLHNLASGEVSVVSENVLLPAYFEHELFLSGNSVVWNESAASPELSRIMAYDIPSATTRLWADDVIGDLTGATDDFFITEQYVNNFPEGADRIVLRRYDADGKTVKLADFRADGLAGQSRILGDRAAWVNPERRILLQPLGGGDRTRFDPY